MIGLCKKSKIFRSIGIIKKWKGSFFILKLRPVSQLKYIFFHFKNMRQSERSLVLKLITPGWEIASYNLSIWGQQQKAKGPESGTSPATYSLGTSAVRLKCWLNKTSAHMIGYLSTRLHLLLNIDTIWMTTASHSQNKQRLRIAVWLL